MKKEAEDMLYEEKVSMISHLKKTVPYDNNYIACS